MKYYKHFKNAKCYVNFFLNLFLTKIFNYNLKTVKNFYIKKNLCQLSFFFLRNYMKEVL